MADPMIITRGLAIPDPNFLHPIGDSWSYSDIFDSTDFTTRVEYEGIGKSTAVNTDGADHDTHYLTSSMSPYGVFGAPWATTALDRASTVVYGLRAKTTGASTNSTSLVRCRLRGYKSDGSASSYHFQSTTDGAYSDLDVTNETDWTLFLARAGSNPATNIYNWKLEIGFNKSSPAGAFVHISWVGVGIMYANSSTYAFDSTSQYAPTELGPNVTRTKWLTPQTALSPKNISLNRGAHAARMSFNFLGLDSTEKAMMDRAEYWAKGQPDDDVLCRGAYPTTRGTRQPLFVALRRNGAKQAFYADAEFGPTLPTTARIQNGIWLDSGTRWDRSVTFQERLF